MTSEYREMTTNVITNLIRGIHKTSSYLFLLICGIKFLQRQIQNPDKTSNFNLRYPSADAILLEYTAGYFLSVSLLQKPRSWNNFT